MKIDVWIINKGKRQIWDKRKQKGKTLQFTDLYEWMYSPGEDGVRPALGRKTWGVCGSEAQCDLAVHAHNSKSSCVEEMWPVGKGKGFCPSALLQWDPIWSDASSSETPSTRSWPVGMSPDEATKMIKDGLRDLGVFRLEKRRPKGDVAASIQ